MTSQKTSCLVALFVIYVSGTCVLSAAEQLWPYLAPVQMNPPRLERRDWARNLIDAYVLEKLEEEQLEPAPEASRLTLIRRLYFDLIGLPPTPEAVDAFLADHDSEAYENVVDRLLADQRYGERWARYWLDLARYADTAGYEGDPDLPHAWRYRDYVIDALNSDKPYDEFIKEQLAGDELEEVMGAGHLPKIPPERVVALTFLRLAPFTEPRGDETRHEMLSEMTGTVISVFMGLTVGCAKCHDHKHDLIPTKDFYRLKAFFSTISIPRPLPGDGNQIGGPIPAEFYRDGEKEWAQRKRERLHKEVEEAKKELANFKITTSEDKQRHQYLSNRERFVIQHLRRLEPKAMSLRHSYGPPFEPGVPTSRVMIRGDHDNPGEVIEAGFLSCITGNQDPAPIRLDPFKRWPTRSRRIALAKWIANADNPLTARVMVNRLWHWHFGRGIVTTPSDFGSHSGGPSHSALLDVLALNFIENKWSIKAMHRLMVTSSTYRQSSDIKNEKAEIIDPDNTLLWHFNRRRLEAESIRDNILAVSGRLNSELGGLPIFPPLPGDIAEVVKYTQSKWDTQYGDEGRKRSIYIYQQRTLTMPFLQTFDALVCEESRPRRRSSVTPLQALAMYNGDLVNDEARHFARRIRADQGNDRRGQINFAFRLALSRPPSTEESEYFRKFLTANGSVDENLAGLCRILYNTNEFIYID